MADTLNLQDITVECRLGVHDWEREAPQTAWVDLELQVDAAAAAAADDVGSTVDYAALVQSVRRLAQSRPYRLLETLAEEIASLVLGEAGTPWVRVRVKKQALPGVGYAAVEIERAAARPAARGGRPRMDRRLAKGRRRTVASGR